MNTPIFDQLRDERLLMDDDLIPQRGLPEMDLQSLAYREMPPQMVVGDDTVRHFVVRHHEPLAGHPANTLRQPDDYEAAGWDAGREDPR